MSDKTYLIGLMSGTSLDGVDAALIQFDADHPAGCLIATQYDAYPAALSARLLALQDPSDNELHHAAMLANELADLYAVSSNKLIARTNIFPTAIACHGQTVRHRPDAAYTIQLVNAARLAEQTHTTVIADFRSRDIAAGGQGAPLVPAFHAAAFGQYNQHIVVINIGGIANLTDLPTTDNITGFDCGPGNGLMDSWCLMHTGHSYDSDGAWGAQGAIISTLLSTLLAHPYLHQAPPKSAGREQFNLDWLNTLLTGDELATDVQATLVAFTALSIALAVTTHCAPNVDAIYLCGGGVHNHALVHSLQNALPNLPLQRTDALGIDADWLEAHAFAWLGWQTLQNLPGNLSAVTGARHTCILGAIYPA
jgi:anhydro-N-acetylmuramic acid kinase